jgi:hypothetical protein
MYFKNNTKMRMVWRCLSQNMGSSNCRGMDHIAILKFCTSFYLLFDFSLGTKGGYKGSGLGTVMQMS